MFSLRESDLAQVSQYQYIHMAEFRLNTGFFSVFLFFCLDKSLAASVAKAAQTSAQYGIETG